MAKKSNPSSDLRGVGRLTIDAIKGIIDLVESIHYKITSFGGLLGEPEKKQTTGITGMVYKNIRSVSEFVGSNIDVLLDNLTFLIKDKESSPEREAVLAALNGVLGDYLLEKKNPLAISMQLRKNGMPIFADDQALSVSLRRSKLKIVLLVHGSCMNDLQWKRQGHDHGDTLAKDLGYLPVYLHYNTGRHISKNGRECASQLESFINQLPGSIDLTIIGHSMGGLVSRSACYYGKQLNHSWLSSLRKLVFLGTPHHGAPLEQGGNWIDNFLEISPYSKPLSRLGKIRSAGITDLRYGNLLDGDWVGRDRFADSGDQRTPVPLPDGVQCYTIAATIAKVSSKLGDGLIGDGLVPLNSALGRHKNPELNLLFPETHQWIGRTIKHLDLLNHPDIYKTIKNWLIA